MYLDDLLEISIWYREMNKNTPQNIYIVGAQSTGKTTLVKALEVVFNQENVPDVVNGHLASSPATITEVARTVLKKHNFTAEDITASPVRALALQQLILQAQLVAERDALAEAEWFISDRSGIDPLVYARKYAEAASSKELIDSPAWLELRERMRESLVVVCEAGADWLTDDGVRLMPESKEDWIETHRVFCDMMGELGIGHKVLPCGVTDRRKRVEFVLEKWRQG